MEIGEEMQQSSTWGCLGGMRHSPQANMTGLVIILFVLFCLFLVQ